MEPNFKEVERIIAAALAEDIGKGDITAQLLVPETAHVTLTFVNREPMLVCGAGIVPLVFSRLDPSIQTKALVKEGNHAAARTNLIIVQGPARSILTAERVALNLLQRMSSVATLASQYVKAVEGTGAIILDTRKTMPGLRELDKYAVRTGGARNHRMRLDDGILIKDNHIALCGDVATALKRAQDGNRENLPIEIECETLAQVEAAMKAGAKSLMLDNMDIPTMHKAVQLVAGRATLEASGNVSLNTVRRVAETGVNFISVGKLTHSVPNVDIGLDSIFTP